MVQVNHRIVFDDQDHEKIIIRSYDSRIDRAKVEDLERRCEVGPTERVFLFTDTLGDPICRIRNSPIYNMLVAELGNELVGVIQGSIKFVTFPTNQPPLCTTGLTKVGYVLGLRVVPGYRRKGIGLSLVRKLEEWFVTRNVDFSYMATEKDNEASVKLFVDKLGYMKFRTPSILVNPVNHHRMFRLSSDVEIRKVNVDVAKYLYQRFMGSTTEFFPDDIDSILRNKLSLGTWVAYPKGDGFNLKNSDGKSKSKSESDSYSKSKTPENWAMLSVWNSGELFKLRLEKAPLSCLLYTKTSRLIDKLFPCFKVPALPDFFRPFGFYFMYGIYHEGPFSGKLVRKLCEYVHNLGSRMSKDCKVIVTEIGGKDKLLKVDIPHWKLLSCPEDLWCIKGLKNEDHNNNSDHNYGDLIQQLTKNPSTTTPLFVDPREV